MYINLGLFERYEVNTEVLILKYQLENFKIIGRRRLILYTVALSLHPQIN